MSVLACEREGCDNVMCERVVTTHGSQRYICEDCYDELRAQVNVWPRQTTIEEVSTHIDMFMDNEAESEFVDGDCIIEEFDRLTQPVDFDEEADDDEEDDEED